MRFAYVGVVLLGVAVVPGTAPQAGPAVADWPAPTGYRLPVAGSPSVARPFVPPPTPYAAGHRGVDLSVAPHAVVVAAADGRVVFAGAVAGRGLVVLEHADTVRTEYEPLDVTVRAESIVRAGAPIGRVNGTHANCPKNRCLHWGARRGGDYFDPMSLLARLGPVRLMPWSTDVTRADVPG